LEPRSILGDLCMTVMAGSMAYMFVTMQLMAPMTRRRVQLAGADPQRCRRLR
jgi:hypothetical protein